MPVKSINKDVCASCSLRKAKRCPVPDSCPTDVFKQGEDGSPFVAYPDDCQECYVCERDCPHGAVCVSAVKDWPVLSY